MKPNKRHRSQFLHIRTLKGMKLQDRVDFSYVDIKRYFKVLLWDKGKNCQWCFNKILTFEQATLDHIIPKNKGGHTRLANLQLMHKRCNCVKSNRITKSLSKNLYQKCTTMTDSNKRRHERIKSN